jgi:arsenate reductase
MKSPPDSDTLKALLNLLGMGPRELLRTKEKLYKELGLDDPQLSDAELIQAMVENPRLIERPIVIHGDQAVIARPVEKLKEIL